MLLRVVIVLFITIILACVATPLVYSGMIMLDQSGWLWFGMQPFSRVYDRVLSIILLIILIVFRKHLPGKLLLATLQKETWSRSAGLILAGTVLTFCCAMLGVGYIAYASAADWDAKSAAQIIQRFVQTIPVAVVVSLIEEAVFRVILFTSLIAQLGVLPAAFISSLLYAVVHFVSPDRSYIYPGYSLEVGFEYVAAVVARLALPGVIYGVIGLFLIGLIQCAALRRSGSIYLSVGMHAGWILAAKTAAKFLKLDDILGGIAPGLGTRYFLVGHPIGWLCIVAAGLVMLLLTKKKSSSVVAVNV